MKLAHCRGFLGLAGIACGVCLAVAPMVGCGGDESYNASFIPQDKIENPEDLGPLSPIEVGTQLWYSFSASFRRTISGGGQLTQGEAQSGGSLCLNVDEVRDTATSAYKNASETLVVARTRATGTTGGAALDFSDQANTTATAQQVDVLLQPLWLKHLTVRSASHGFESAKSATFTTQAAPLSTNGLSALPFFDVRRIPTKHWSGWDYREDQSGDNNLLGLLYKSFPDPQAIKRRSVTPPLDCDKYADVQTCTTAQCTWSTPPGGMMSSCLSLYTVRVVWRESLTVPQELAGSVLHQVKFMYDLDGVLTSASEVLYNDSGTTVPSELTGCQGQGACLSGDVTNFGAWASPMGDAPCQF